MELLQKFIEPNPNLTADQIMGVQSNLPLLNLLSRRMNPGDASNDWDGVTLMLGSIGAQLSGCILGDLKGKNLEVISYDNSEFNQKLLQEGLTLVKSIIDEKYCTKINVNLVIDTKVEKIEDSKEEKVNEDDIVSLFDGKDML